MLRPNRRSMGFRAHTPARQARPRRGFAVLLLTVLTALVVAFAAMSAQHLVSLWR